MERAEVHMTRVSNSESAGRTVSRTFSEVAAFVAKATGEPAAFIIAAAIVVVWSATGPLFHFSDTWQLVINTGTTIVTFLMVFLIQNSQNRDSTAIQVKLDELIRASRARNAFIGIEHLTEAELEELRKKSETRAKTKAGRTERGP